MYHFKIDSKLKWTENTISMNKKGVQRLHFLRKLKYCQFNTKQPQCDKQE